MERKETERQEDEHVDHVAEGGMAADNIVADDCQQVEKPCGDEHTDGGALTFGDAEDKTDAVADGGGCSQNDECCFVKHWATPPCGIARTSRERQRQR